MHILLIEAGHIEIEWLQAYMQRYATDVTVDGARSLQEAETYLQAHKADVDVIILDTTVHDLLDPATMFRMVDAAGLVPIVLMMTGKAMHFECSRIPHTRVFHLRTDVSTDAFLHHLRTLTQEIQGEQHAASIVKGEATDGA